MNHTRDDIANAAEGFTKHLMAMVRLLQMDTSKAPPAAVEGCKRAHAAAMNEPAKFYAMIEHPAVDALFKCGALFFGRRA